MWLIVDILNYKHIKTPFDYKQTLFRQNCESEIEKCIYETRISAHNSRVVADRYCRNRLGRNERTCLIIANSNDIEDEYHFILLCDVCNDLRVLNI